MYIISRYEVNYLELSSFHELQLKYHVNIQNTKQFLKTHDTYDHWALFIAENGSFEYRLGDYSGVAVKGDCVLVPPGLTFYRKTTSLSFHLMGFQWKTANEGSGASIDDFPYFGKLRLLNNKRLMSSLAQFREANYLNQNLMMAYKNHLLRDLMYILQIELFDQNINALYTEDPILQQAVRKIQQQAEFGISLKTIAHDLGINQVQFTRLFKREFHTTPSAFAANLRMDKVKLLLVNSSLTLAQISEHCGFTDEHHLSKSFKKRFGMNPSLYRKKYSI